MVTKRSVFRFSAADLSLMDQLAPLLGLSNRSALLRYLVYHEAKRQGVVPEVPEAELKTGRPKKGSSGEGKNSE